MKHLVLSLEIIILSLFVLLNSGCTKEGPEGRPGLDGSDGKDGAESCTNCHNTAEILTSRVEQYSYSKHAEGSTTNRNSEQCASCHTSMGFRNTIETGSTGMVENPTPVNCRTCHPIHETFTVEDYGLRTSDAVALNQGEGNYDFGNSNVCANCHQSRPVSPFPDGSSGESVTVNNAHYGSHHGPQANIFVGEGPYKFAGSMTYSNSAHTTVVENGCVTCHMSSPTGTRAGGHQMNVKYTNVYGGESYQLTGCLTTGCHTSASEVQERLDLNKAEIGGLLADIKTRLQEREIFDDSGHLIVPKTMSQDELGAVLNYSFIYEDKSFGAHNYPYSKALLTNTFESLE